MNVLLHTWNSSPSLVGLHGQAAEVLRANGFGADVIWGAAPDALQAAGYGMVLSEALWASVPVIAARVGAAEQLISRSGAGLLYEPDDQAALGATLTAFVSDAVLRAKLRRSAWLSAQHLPRWRDTTQKFAAALDRADREKAA